MGWGQGSLGRGQWPESRGSGLNGWVQAPPLRACDGVMWLRGRTRPGPGLWTCRDLHSLARSGPGAACTRNNNPGLPPVSGRGCYHPRCWLIGLVLSVLTSP